MRTQVLLCCLLLLGVATALATRKEEAAENNRRKNSQPFYRKQPARVAPTPAAPEDDAAVEEETAPSVTSPLLTRKQEAAEINRRKNNQPLLNRHPARVTSEDEYDEEEAGEFSDQCPEPNGYFPDAEQCDKYYDCRDGKLTEKLCPDGLVFNDFSPQHEKCDLPFGIDCSKRPKLQTPIPTAHCPRMHGYFAHEDPTNCNTFYYCVEGKFNMIKCPDGLVFSEKTGICTWPDEAHKTGCGSRELFNFTCPKVDESVAATHPRYPDSEDCQFFYVCINGETPRRSGCKLGQAFDESTGKCDWARKVPECKEWYKGVLTDAELDALENPPKAKTSGSSRRKGPKRGAEPAAE
ncbi:cuticular protein analogous to peritrophins 3-B isoform X1 [Nasonia vitripennis]|uniref:Chitin-binding type-2 domain-containing protein n=1 Tax=Nasonia vitripennis TaxID=7425 RepID=A0A7M7QJD9_NASVI|nr:cuticular protein analogous to peritrophins 3-B isoform X1 [Nasonia vitripennis]